jgi:hypothetical protein
VSDLWSELSRQLADRWFSLLVLPGALYLAVALAARTLGEQHPLDIELLYQRIAAEAERPAVTGTAGQIMLLVIALAGAAAAGVAAQAVGALVERVALTSGWNRWPLAAATATVWWVEFRQRRWDDADRAHEEQLQLALLPDAGDRPDLTVRKMAAARRSRIAVERPERLTWTGDRIQAVVQRLDRDHHVDLAIVWPYLERVIPDDLRADIQEARQAMSRAATLAGWAALYALLTWWWWPAALLALLIAATSRHRIRSTTDTYARLLEVAARLHLPALATQLGIDHTGPLDRPLGTDLTQRLRTVLPPPANP